MVAERDERQSAWVCFQRFLASEIKDSTLDNGKNERLEDAVGCMRWTGKVVSVNTLYPDNTEQ